jgi:hypothetical protein
MNHRIEELVLSMCANQKNADFADLVKVCNYYFGQPRQNGTSHIIYKMPWQGDPRINIQRNGKEAKAYQVKQVLLAIKKLKESKNECTKQ